MIDKMQTASSVAETAALFNRPVFLTTFAGYDYHGTAVKIVGGLSSPAVLVLTHAGDIVGSPIGATETHIPLQDIADIAMDLGDNLTILGAAPVSR